MLSEEKPNPLPKLPFLTIACWSNPNYQKSPPAFAKSVFLLFAEIYFSDGKVAKFCVKDKDAYLFTDSPIFIPLPVTLKGIRAISVLSVTVVALRGVSLIAVRRGYENHLFQVLQAPVKGFALKVLAGSVVAIAAMTLVLLAVKVFLRCTRECFLVKIGHRLNKLQPPSPEEVD